MTQLNPNSILAIGKFATPPILEDLQGLTLDELFGGTRLFWWLVTIIVLIVLFGLRKRKSLSSAVSFERNR
jgi:hypothetical protein